MNDIATVPKDGTRIIAYSDRNTRIRIMRWHQPANPDARGFWTTSSVLYLQGPRTSRHIRYRVSPGESQWRYERTCIARGEI